MVDLVDKEPGQIFVVFIACKTEQFQEIADCKGVGPQITPWLCICCGKSRAKGKFIHQIFHNMQCAFLIHKFPLGRHGMALKIKAELSSSSAQNETYALWVYVLDGLSLHTLCHVSSSGCMFDCFRLTTGRNRGKGEEPGRKMQTDAVLPGGLQLLLLFDRHSHGDHIYMGK